MKKKIKKTKKQVNILIIIISIIIFLIILLFTFFKLSKIQIKNYINISKQPNSIVTQKSFVITNESGSIKKEIPINPASVGDIKFESPVNVTPRPTFTPVIKIIQNEEADKDNNFNYLFKAINSKDEIYKIEIDAAKFLYDSGRAVFIDARSRVEYNESHIKGSISIPTNATPEEINDLKNKLKGKILVTYCHGIGCHLSDKVSYKLFDMGYRNIAIFFGGWNKWNEYNYPVEK
jgi:rhodanese-related sulfurtransferase